jgi:hypothetical protein
MCLDRAVLACCGVDGEARKAGCHGFQEEAVDLARSQQSHQCIALLATAGGNRHERRLARLDGVCRPLERRPGERLVRDEHGALTGVCQLDGLALARRQVHVVMLVAGRAYRLEQPGIGGEHRDGCATR